MLRLEFFTRVRFIFKTPENVILATLHPSEVSVIYSVTLRRFASQHPSEDLQKSTFSVHLKNPFLQGRNNNLRNSYWRLKE